MDYVLLIWVLLDCLLRVAWVGDLMGLLGVFCLFVCCFLVFVGCWVFVLVWCVNLFAY